MTLLQISVFAYNFVTFVFPVIKNNNLRAVPCMPILQFVRTYCTVMLGNSDLISKFIFARKILFILVLGCIVTYLKTPLNSLQDKL